LAGGLLSSAGVISITMSYTAVALRKLERQAGEHRRDWRHDHLSKIGTALATTRSE
jgi:hypothetical protein